MAESDAETDVASSTPVKRGRGRPRKSDAVMSEDVATASTKTPSKRRRGRPSLDEEALYAGLKGKEASDTEDADGQISAEEFARYAKQERMIAQNLGFNEDEFVSDDRVALAKYVVDIDLAMLKESVLLFSPDQVQINPMNVLQYIETLLDYSYAIAEMATVRAPVWCYDRIESFEIELQKLATYGDAGFKQKLVLLLRLFADAQERSDIAALADLFSGEVPSLLRSLAQNIKNGGLQHITA